MKIREIANAQEQIGLLKIIMDKTWEALAAQARQQSQQGATAKPPVAKARTPKATQAPHPKKLPTPHQPSQPKPKYPKPAYTQNLIAPNKPRPANKALLNQRLQIQNQLTAPKDGYLGRNVSTAEKNGYGDERHSENGINVQKNLPR